VLTLTDTAGRQVDTTRTEPDGTYRLTAPGAGTYLLVCLPAPAQRPHELDTAPQAAWVSLDGVPVTHDIG
jgi:hypothetical protein